jgi:hypothetical protein
LIQQKYKRQLYALKKKNGNIKTKILENVGNDLAKQKHTE